MNTKRTSREPTEEMLNAGDAARCNGQWVDEVWKAMHDVAPEAAEAELVQLGEALFASAKQIINDEARNTVLEWLSRAWIAAIVAAKKENSNV